jgi:acyl carrier protein
MMREEVGAQPLEPAELTLDERVARLIVEQLRAKPAQIVPDASFIDDLGADSLAIVQLVMAIEEAFDIEIPDADADQLQTIGDAVAYLHQRLEG